MKRKILKTTEDILEWLCGKDLWVYSWCEPEGTYVYVRVFDKLPQGLYGCQFYLAPESCLNDIDDLGISHEGWYSPAEWKLRADILDETYTDSEFPAHYNEIVDQEWGDASHGAGYIDMENY